MPPTPQTAPTDKKDAAPAPGKNGKKQKKPPVRKNVFVYYGAPGQGTLVTFSQKLREDKKGKKGEDLYISPKAQAEAFINDDNAPPGPFEIIEGVARRTKHKL